MAGESGVSRAARNVISVYLRLALGVDFLSAVADRFGLWGPPGSPNVQWGSFSKFVAYTAKVDPFAPARTANTVAGIITGLEIVFGVLLILGFRTRITAFLSGIMLALFGIGMSVGTGAKSAFDTSVFAASAGAFALAAFGSHALSIDSKRRKKRAAAPSPAPATSSVPSSPAPGAATEHKEPASKG